MAAKGAAIRNSRTDKGSDVTKTCLQVLACLLVAVSIHGETWVPVDCADRADEVNRLRASSGAGPFDSDWARYEARVRTARKDDPLYVPKPYPKKSSDAIEDFRYAFFERLFPDRTTLSPTEGFVYDAVLSDEVAFEIETVENWTPSRCDSFRPIRRYLLLRLRDPDGKELARAALHESGVFGQFAILDGPEQSIDDLASIGTRIRQKLRLDLGPSAKAQRVITEGLPYRCTAIMPCTALRANGRSYLVDHRDLIYVLAPGAPIRTVSQLRADQKSTGLRPLNTDDPGSPWISVGFGWQKATLVSGQPPSP